MFEVKKGDHAYNQQHYEQLGEVGLEESVMHVTGVCDWGCDWGVTAGDH